MTSETSETRIDIRDVFVFVVEDNPDNGTILERLLKKGVGILPSMYNLRASGRYLMQWVNANPERAITLILLDIQIPREDGYMVLKQIRQHPGLQATKVVAVTANVMEIDVERCRRAGFDGFIGKPLVRERFPEQIHRILRGEEVWEPR